MLNPFDGEFLKAAGTNRPDYGTLCTQTREGLATYFEGEALRQQVEQWPKEDPEKFRWRREISLDNYDNYTKEVAENYIEGVFRAKQPIRKTGNGELDQYLSEEYQDWFTTELLPFTLFLPEVFVVLDMPQPKGEIVSMADAKELQGLPKLNIRFPQYSPNFGFDENGNLSWVAFYKDGVPVVQKQSDVEKATQKKNATLYELYTPEWYLIFNQDGEIIGEPIEHKYGMLPVVRISYRPNLSLIDSARAGHSFMHSVVKLALGGLKAKGMLYDYVYYSLFPKFVGSEGTIQGMIEAGVGSNKPIAVPPNDDTKPYYLSVPIQELEALERICYERIPNAVYRNARLRDRSGTSVQSGISKLFDMVPELGVLKAVAKFFKSFDVELVTKMAQLMDIKKPPEIEYPQTFDTKSATEMMTEITALGAAMTTSSLPSSPYASSLLSQRAYRALLPDVTPDVMDRIEKEIEAALNEAEQETPEEESAEIPPPTEEPTVPDEAIKA